MTSSVPFVYFVLFLLKILFLRKKLFCSVFIKDFIFKKNFRFKAKLRGRYRDFLYTAGPHKSITSPIINIPHQSGTSVIPDEHTGSIISPGVVHSIGLVLYLPLWYHRLILITLRSSVLCLFILPLSFPNPRKALVFYYLHGFDFSGWNTI